jgi:hypothetical protein
MVMMKSRWTKRLKRAAGGGALGLAVLMACAAVSARAADDDDSDKNSIWNLDQRILGDFMRSLGLRNGNEPQIDYRERSPLVVPPSRNLPPPEASVSPRNPAWPVDPDVKRKRDADAKRKVQSSRGYDIDREGRVLTPSELNPPGARTTTGSVTPGTPAGSTSDGKPLLPSELGYFGGLFSAAGFGFGAQKDEVGTFTAEPPRTSLTAPPVGYQTPSPAQPYGVTKRIEYEKPMKTEDIPVGGIGR